MVLQVTATGAISSELALMGASVRALGRRLVTAITARAQDIRDPYRPELHYMCGPGPRWREHRTTGTRKVGHANHA